MTKGVIFLLALLAATSAHALLVLRRLAGERVGVLKS